MLTKLSTGKGILNEVSCKVYFRYMQRFYLVLLIFFCYSCEQKQKEQTHSERNAQSNDKRVTQSHSVVKDVQTPAKSVKIDVNCTRLPGVILSAPITGRLSPKTPQWKTGSKVKKGQLLFLFDNYDAFIRIRTKKTELKLALEKIVIADSSERRKLTEFSATIKTDRTLPAFPKFELNTLRILDQNKLLDAYDELVEDENAMSKYFVFATDDGILRFESRDSYEAGQKLAEIHTGLFLLNPAPKSSWSVSIFDKHDKSIFVKVVRKSGNGVIVRGNLVPGQYYYYK